LSNYQVFRSFVASWAIYRKSRNQSSSQCGYTKHIHDCWVTLV